MQTVFDTVLVYTTPQVIALITGCSIFFLLIFFAIIRDEVINRHAREKRVQDEWLFKRWDEKIYDALMSMPPEKVLKSLGVDTEKYLKDCAVIRNHFPNLKKLAADKLIGCFLVVTGIMLLALSGLTGIIFTVVILLLGLKVYECDVKKVKKLADSKRKQIQNELPRFLDLLQTALYINMSVNDAITVTATHLKGTMISEELLATMAETQISAISWQEALQDIATKYEVDSFSDFVLYLITGYEKGLNIYDVVSRQAREVRQYQLISAEERANKVNSAIIVPVAVYKLVPLLLICGLPLIMQFMKTNSIF